MQKPLRVKQHSGFGSPSVCSGVHIPSVKRDSQCRRRKERGRERESRDSELIDYTVLKWSASQPCKYVTNDSARGIDSRLCCGSGEGGRGNV